MAVWEAAVADREAAKRKTSIAEVYRKAAEDRAVQADAQKMAAWEAAARWELAAETAEADRMAAEDLAARRDAAAKTAEADCRTAKVHSKAVQDWANQQVLARKAAEAEKQAVIAAARSAGLPEDTIAALKRPRPDQDIPPPKRSRLDAASSSAPAMAPQRPAAGS